MLRAGDFGCPGGVSVGSRLPSSVLVCSDGIGAVDEEDASCLSEGTVDAIEEREDGLEGILLERESSSS